MIYIESEVQEFERFALRKRANRETSSFRMAFLRLTNIEDGGWEIVANQLQGRHKASVGDLTILRIGIIAACELSGKK
jgi:hypothetical protein